ncbi:MAG: hypothetical protein K8R37_11725, partial [Bacteroidales bacterium]|nr:hypothetical protein [Bacteroidales bacterium]
MTNCFTQLKVIISRTDSIGDVMLTLPVAGVLKKFYPNVVIYFLGKAYTKGIVESCEHIDFFLDWTEIKKMDLKSRILKIKNLNADVIIHVFPVKE